LHVGLYCDVVYYKWKIFGPKKHTATGEWRKLQNEELQILYSSPNIIRQIKLKTKRWARHVTHMEEERKLYKVLVGKSKGKRPLGRPRRRWENGTIMDLWETGWGSVQ
jgi:hypothetical protein